MSDLKFRSTLVAVFLLLACPLVASGQDAEAEIESALEAFNQAQLDLDADALKQVLAPKFTLTSYNCATGEETRDSRDEVVDDMRMIAATGASLTKEVRGRTIHLLGGGPIAVVRQATTETVAWDSGSLTLQASETFYLNKIGDAYKLTSASTRTVCDSMQMSGTLPELPEG